MRSSSTLSLILEMVSFDTVAAYASSKRAATSPVVSPLAVRDYTIRLTPSRRRFPFGTMTGSKLPARSHGTSISTGPISVNTVLVRVPSREFPE